MSNPRLRSILPSAMFLLLAAGASLVAYGAWVRPLREAGEMLQSGDLRGALERFKAAEARFDHVALAKQLFPGDYAGVLASEVWILYRLGELDETIERTASDPSGRLRFWSGCALLGKARGEQKGDAALTWLTRAKEEFRRTLESDPDDWDAKFNYE